MNDNCDNDSESPNDSIDNQVNMLAIDNRLGRLLAEAITIADTVIANGTQKQKEIFHTVGALCYEHFKIVIEVYPDLEWKYPDHFPSTHQFELFKNELPPIFFNRNMSIIANELLVIFNKIRSEYGYITEVISLLKDEMYKLDIVYVEDEDKFL